MKNYSYKPAKKARFVLAHASALGISPKDAREVAAAIRSKPVASAERILGQVMDRSRPIRFKRHNTELGHKPGIGPARYPVNAAEEIMTLLANATSSAKAKGMDEKLLRVAHIAVSRSFHKRPGGARAFAKGPSNHSRRATVEMALEEIRR